MGLLDRASAYGTRVVTEVVAPTIAKLPSIRVRSNCMSCAPFEFIYAGTVTIRCHDSGFKRALTMPFEIDTSFLVLGATASGSALLFTAFKSL